MTANNVLIIDDNELDVLIQRRHLERSGRFGTVSSAADGQAAIDMYLDHQRNRATTLEDTAPGDSAPDDSAPGDSAPDDFPPRLVLLDINMPRVDGFEFLRRYREFGIDPENHFIVIVTSSDAARDIERAANDPSVDDYLVKPLTRASVIELADRFLPR